MKVDKKVLNILVIILFFVTSILLAKAIINFDKWRLGESKNLLIESQEVNSKDAFIMLQKAALLHPSEETYLRAGIKAEELGYSETANSYFKRVKTGDGFYQLGISYFNQKDYPKAKNTFAKAISKEFKAEYYLAKAKSELALVELEQAQADIGKSLGVQTGDEARFYSYLISLIIGDKAKTPELNKENFKLVLSQINQYSSAGNRANVIFDALNSLNYPQLAAWYLKDQEQKGALNRDGYLLLAEHYSSTKDQQNEYGALLKAKLKDEYYPQTYKQLAIVAKELGKNDEAKTYEDFCSKLVW